MSTTIRLTRMGRKKRPFYRLVVLDSRKRRDGAYLANLGYYNPFCDPHEVELHQDEILAWLGKGATVSETARALLRAEGVLYKFSLIKDGVEESDIEARMGQWHERADKRRQDKLDAVAAKAAEAKAAADQAREEAEAAAKAEEAAAAKAAADEAAAAEAEKKAAEEAAAAEAAAEAAEEATEETTEAPAEETAAAEDEKKEDN